jgi:tape measure domain-containing protein
MALTVKIRADASQFKKTIAGIEVQASGLTGVMAKLGGSIPVFGAALSAAAAGAVALGAGLAFIKDASGKAAGMESLTVQFEVLTKSASKATELIQSFRDEAIKSPLSVQDYAQAGKTLMAFGIAADDTLPILKTLGDVSMGNAERFGSLALAFAQTQAAGRLMGQEVLQFVNAGFNPLQEISRKTSRSMVELKKAMEDGAISSQMVTDAFKSATSQGGLFFGALDKGASTTEGKIAKLGDAVMGLKVSFGTGFNEGLKSALDATNEFLPQLESKFATAGEMLGFAIKESIAGNHEMLAAIGAIIGETIMAGVRAAIKIGFSSLIREGIGGYVGLGGHLTGNPETKVAGHAINAGIAGMLGQGTSMADTMKGESGGIERAIAAMEKLVESKSENLPRGFVNKYDNMEKLQTEYLRKISEQSGYQLMFSR